MKYSELNKKFLNYFVDEKQGENIVFSPLSIVLLLTIAAQSTDGTTRDEITKALEGDESYVQLLRDVRKLQMDLTASKNLTIANAVVVKEALSKSIKPEYERGIKSAFHAPLIKSSNIKEDVNAWVNKETKGMIPEIGDDAMNQVLTCLINAILFDAQWQDKYGESDIHEGEKFTNADDTESKVTMLSSTEDHYIEDDFFIGFVKPYKNQYSFVALLPKKKGKTFCDRTLNQIDFTDLFHKTHSCDVHVQMPEFDYEFDDDITNLCQDMGVKDLFMDQADFSPMSTEQLRIDRVIHKARIQVNRKGTKAAAVTMAFMITGAPGEYYREQKTVILDRPFVYAIVENDTGLPVFTGMVNKLEN